MEFGFLESVYEKCLLIEVKKSGLQSIAQSPITVYYDNKVVGEFVAFIVVKDVIILELKSVHRLVKAHKVQLVNYLTATGKDVDLLINYRESKVEIRRKVRELKDFKHANS